MDTQLLKTVGQVAGLGGVALGVFLLVFREVIRKNLFPSLTRNDAYRVIQLILVLTFLIAALGIGAWVWVQSHPRVQPGQVDAKSWNRLDGEYKLRLVELAESGCFFFDWDKSTLLEVPDFVAAAQRQFLENSGLLSDSEVEIQGFIESGYSQAYAVRLSLRRAEFLKRQLAREYRIDESKISTMGLGSGNPPRVKEFFCGAKVVPRGK